MNQYRARSTVAKFFGLLSAHGPIGPLLMTRPATRLDFPDTTTPPQSHFGQFLTIPTRPAAAAATNVGCYTIPQ